MQKHAVSNAYHPVALSISPVADLVSDVFVQGGGGGVRAGPRESPASIACIVERQTNWRFRLHCTEEQKRSLRLYATEI